MKKAKRTCGGLWSTKSIPDTQRVNDTIIYKLCLFSFFFLYFSDAVSRRKKQEINSIRLDQPNEPLRDENRKEMEKIAKPQTHDVRKRREEDSLEGVLRGYIIVLQSQIQTIGKRARRRGREEEKWLGCWSRANNGLGLPALGARPMQDSAASHQSLWLSLGQWQIRIVYPGFCTGISEIDLGSAA